MGSHGARTAAGRRPALSERQRSVLRAVVMAYLGDAAPDRLRQHRPAAGR